MSDGHVVYGSTIDGGFWQSIRETVVREGLPYQWRALNDQVPGAVPSGCMHNFHVASGREKGEFIGCVFQDSDAYKWLEAVAYSLRFSPDKELEAIADGAIEDIAAAQQPDGYLDTYYIINGLDRRWTDLMGNHELYCAGHMIEAAVAYYQATGKRRLLDVAIRLCDHIDSVIGPEEGKKRGYPGHPVIEMALMRLYEVTKDEKHLKMAKYFVDERGQSPLYFETEKGDNNWSWNTIGMKYFQTHIPVREQKDAVGHAVRALYLYSGMADVARVTDDDTLKQACRTLWQSVARKRMYITGGVGSTHSGEAFTFDYDLPNDTAYTETCAAIALCFFARRMLTLEPKGDYADVMERALYNGVISGMALDGKKFFYVNPLEVQPEACEGDPNKRHVKPERVPWLGCACCPPNLFRIMTSLEDYIATVNDGALYVNLYTQGEISAFVGKGEVNLRVETNYPWDGAVRLTLTQEGATEGTIGLRKPGWCGAYALTVNGEACEAPAKDGYIMLTREWKPNDVIELNLDMPVRLVRADPRVRENAGKVALTRGPIVYCLEQIDNGADMHLLRAPEKLEAKVEWTDELGGVNAITTAAKKEACAWEGGLYEAAPAPETAPVTLRWIPYYAWANRGAGEMTVWIRG